MKIYCLFGQRKCLYPGQHAPELLEAWDEYSVEENPEGFAQAMQKAREENQEDMVSIAPYCISINEERIKHALANVTEVATEILQ